MTEDQMREIARGSIGRNLSDAVYEDGPDSIYDNAYTLAVDALLTRGVERHKAQAVALEIAQAYAQP
jgi:hypothetical protein